MLARAALVLLCGEAESLVDPLPHLRLAARLERLIHEGGDNLSLAANLGVRPEWFVGH